MAPTLTQGPAPPENLHVYLKHYARSHQREHFRRTSPLCPWLGARTRYCTAHTAQCPLAASECEWAHTPEDLAPTPPSYRPYEKKTSPAAALEARAYGGYVSERAYAECAGASLWASRGSLSLKFSDLYPTLLSEALLDTLRSKGGVPVFDIAIVVCDQFALYGKCGDQARCRYLHVRRRALRRAFGRARCECTLAERGLFCPGEHATGRSSADAGEKQAKKKQRPPGLASPPTKPKQAALENWSWFRDDPLGASTLRLIE